jgi:hypothetical protein
MSKKLFLKKSYADALRGTLDESKKGKGLFIN